MRFVFVFQGMRFTTPAYIFTLSSAPKRYRAFGSCGSSSGGRRVIVSGRWCLILLFCFVCSARRANGALFLVQPFSSTGTIIKARVCVLPLFF